MRAAGRRSRSRAGVGQREFARASGRSAGLAAEVRKRETVPCWAVGVGAGE